MKDIKSLVEEQSSPLFRIMSVHNFTDTKIRSFNNNISCFHIGNGYFISVCHSLRAKNIPNKIREVDFLKIINNIGNQALKEFMQTYYQLNIEDLYYYLSNIPNKPHEQSIIFNQILTYLQIAQYNTSVENDYTNNISCPVLIIQFKNNEFYNDPILTKQFQSHQIMNETYQNRFTFLLELEVAKTFYEEDICVYKLKNIDKGIINKIPFLEIDFNFYDNLSDVKLFCLQSSPSSELGKMLNTSSIDGISDHWSNFSDNIHQNYLVEGKRYITKNYFRFGSSGAPYVIYNKDEDKLYFNAVQSEAAPIQMMIQNSREGNLQYTHAIATPLNNIKEYLITII